MMIQSLMVIDRLEVEVEMEVAVRNRSSRVESRIELE